MGVFLIITTFLIYDMVYLHPTSGTEVRQVYGEQRMQLSDALATPAVATVLLVAIYLNT
jgi:hypothetical protein